jgi:hypothetical protein
VVLVRLVTDPENVIASHWTALGLHELVATRSQQVHLTVPASQRPRPRAALPWVRVHTTADLPGGRMTMRSGIPVVSPARAIADVAAEENLGFSTGERREPPEGDSPDWTTSPGSCSEKDAYRGQGGSGEGAARARRGSGVA